MENSCIEEAINSIEKVLTNHENHLFPADRNALELAVSRMRNMLKDGFK